MEVTKKESVLLRLKRGFLVLLISACIRRVPRTVIALSFNLPESHSWHSPSSLPDTHSTPGPCQVRVTHLTAGLSCRERVMDTIKG